MFNVKFIISAIVAIAIGLIGIQAEAQIADPQESQEASVSGTVVDASTGDALSGIQVQVEESEETAESNQEGEFSFENLEPGSHTLTVEEDGYEEWSQTIQVSEDGTSDDIEVSLQSSY